MASRYSPEPVRNIGLLSYPPRVRTVGAGGRIEPDDPVRTRLADIAGLCALAAIIRFPTLGTQSYWEDEGYTLHLMRSGFGKMLTTIPKTESSPPLYYVLAWCWTHVFGSGEVGLRSFSAVVGTATVGIVYECGRVITSRVTALLAGALVATNPLLVWYSQEARSYMLLVFFSSLSVLLFLRALEGQSAWGWATVSALALCTHYFAVFLILPEAVLLARRRKPLRRLLPQLGIVAATGLALLPLALHQQSRHYPFEDVAITTRLAQIPKQFLVGFGLWYFALGKLAGAVAGILIVIGLALFARTALKLQAGRTVAALAVLSIGLPCLLAVIGVDFLDTRNVMGSVIPWVLIVALGFAISRVGIGAALLLCALGIAINVVVATYPGVQRVNWRGASRALGESSVDRALVVTPASALDMYRPKLRTIHSGRIRVGEIDLVGLAIGDAGQRPKPPDSVPNEELPPPFTEFAKILTSEYTVVRYRAPVRMWLTKRNLTRMHLGQIQAKQVSVQFEPRRP
jgi:mannosyltransferase